MSSLADLPELIGFFSYSRDDDADSHGALSDLRSRIQGELRGQLGRTAKTFRLWQDKEAIPSGALWESEIHHSVAQSVFFIPIITPTVVASPYCRFELDAFLAREAALGRSDLVFPLLYITVPPLEDGVRREKDPVLSLIAKRQYVDWRELRHLDGNTTEVKRAIERFCTHIRDALNKSWLSPAEHAAQEKAAALQREEEARKRREADARREEEEARKRAAAAQERERADEARRQREAEAARRSAEERRQRDEAKARRLAAEELRRAEKEEQRRLRSSQTRPPWPPSRPVLVGASVIGLVLIGALGVWLAGSSKPASPAGPTPAAQATAPSPAPVATAPAPVAPTPPSAPAQPQRQTQQQTPPQTYVMKITTSGFFNDISHLWVKAFARSLELDSHGRIKPEVYPADQLGSVPRQIDGTMSGAIQMAVVPLESMSGVDPRFEILAAPGLVDSQSHAWRLAEDPAVRELILGLGTDKGLHGLALFVGDQSVIVSRAPLRHLADFKDRKIRVFASAFQTRGFAPLGVKPVAMASGDVLAALQRGSIDGALTGSVPVARLDLAQGARFLLHTGQPANFLIAEVNRRWFESLPRDLQQILEQHAASTIVYPDAGKLFTDADATFVSNGGELNTLSPFEQAEMLYLIDNGADVASNNPALAAAYKILSVAAIRTR